jgi:hypothetical protein
MLETSSLTNSRVCSARWCCVLWAIVVRASQHERSIHRAACCRWQAGFASNRAPNGPCLWLEPRNDQPPPTAVPCQSNPRVRQGAFYGVCQRFWWVRSVVCAGHDAVSKRSHRRHAIQCRNLQCLNCSGPIDSGSFICLRSQGRRATRRAKRTQMGLRRAVRSGNRPGDRGWWPTCPD